MWVAQSLARRRLTAGGTFRVGRNHPREGGTGRGWGEARSPGRRQRPSQAGSRRLSLKTFGRPFQPSCRFSPSCGCCGCSGRRSSKNRKTYYCRLNAFPPPGLCESEGEPALCEASACRAALRVRGARSTRGRPGEERIGGKSSPDPTTDGWGTAPGARRSQGGARGVFRRGHRPAAEGQGPRAVL